MLILAMIAGAGIYLFYMEVPALHVYGPQLLSACKTVQPVLLFMMLFLSFCKIAPSQMKVEKWMWKLLLVQGGLFAIGAALIVLSDALPGHTPEWIASLASWVADSRIPLESFMLCMICPTATAAAVVTGKLGGSMAGVVTYTVLINLLVALLVPAVVPFLYPAGGLSFGAAFIKILSKVFPLLLMPALVAWLLRFILPGVHAWLLRRTQWAFYIWAVSLTLAILMSTRAIVHSGGSVSMLAWIALASFVACMFQFFYGKWAGRRCGEESITAGQAMGQKNTVFAIWMGYTFMDPIVSVAGGFYSIWHNVFNTYQLRKTSSRR